MSTGTQVVITQPEDALVPAEVIATSIVAIANSMKVLTSSRLKRTTIIELVYADTKIARRDINAVLNSLENLERTWLKPK